MKKEQFKGKGKAMLGEKPIGQKPESLDAFLQDEPDSDIASPPHNDVTTRRHDGMTERMQPTIKRKGSDRTVREEFRCTPELADRLSTFVFEQKKIARSLTKTDVVHEALEGFLKRKGY